MRALFLVAIFSLLSVFTPTRLLADQQETVVIRFFDRVTERSVAKLLSTVDQELARGTKKFVVLISSPGGSVFYGLAAHNYLKGIPATVVTHSFGSIDSIAVMIYCAGSERYSVPNARFLLHGIGLTVPGPTRLVQKQLIERLKSMEIDSQNIASVIAQTTGKRADEVEQAIFDGTILTAEEAKSWGLVDDVREGLFEPGARIISIEPSIGETAALDGGELVRHSGEIDAHSSAPLNWTESTLEKTDTIEEFR